jgi:hypothetical protein
MGAEKCERERAFGFGRFHRVRGRVESSGRTLSNEILETGWVCHLHTTPRSANFPPYQLHTHCRRPLPFFLAGTPLGAREYPLDAAAPFFDPLLAASSEAVMAEAPGDLPDLLVAESHDRASIILGGMTIPVSIGGIATLDDKSNATGCLREGWYAEMQI